MAYLILADKGGEFDRRELRQAMVIGRAIECDICVRDILLSRKHCRIEPFDKKWIVADLGSKNGTRIGQETISKHLLEDGDVFRIGKIQVCFRAGEFVPAPKEQQRRRDVRPADPKEALAGTVTGFQYFDMEEDSKASGFPIPKPKPAAPASYRQEEVQSLVAQISSSAWDLALSEPDAETKEAEAVAPAAVKKRNKAIEKERSGAPSIFEPAPPVIRSKSPDRRAAIPRWLAWFYILLAVGLAGVSVAVILNKSGS